ncbi:branched-chain amino acid ABC transporter permease [Actinomadura verrucosospora]|uniref:Branched-chain amino acid ABC transporter permease protein n=1 Tax=Actinomadura verrucosospora TaxID=46165 RepID=A0A7D3VSG9_ACTVE|nr:branched-chain amino acid ABC transporter permease [Actinomadura verrucosospora]QKG21373.1 Branched-chain amino acid ABC transporter permease protein [Actinomadura verrucosospora]
MTKLIELLVNGVSLGMLYALISVGFVVVFRSTDVINFAQGSTLLGGGYVIARLSPHIGFWLAALAGVAATAAFAMLVDRLLIRPLRQRGARHDVAAIVTIGLDIVLLTDLTRRIGSDMLHLGDPWGNAVVNIGPVTVAQTRVAAMATALVLIGLFGLAFQRTGWGVAMRATAEDTEAAMLSGVRHNRVTLSAWAIAGALAAVASVFLTASPSPGMDAATGQTALKAFPAAVVGGLDSMTGALVGGVIMGLAESLASGYQGQLTFLGQGFGSVMPWVVMLLVLLVKPSGLFGTKAAARV